MPTLRCALVQMRCEKGAIAENLGRIGGYLDAAEAAGSAVACFPEASITGYVDPRSYPEALVTVDGPEVAAFAAMTRTRRITAIGGIVEARPEPGAKPFLTQVVARGGAIIAVYRKRTIPDDERELFEPATGVTTFDVGNVNCGLAICADIECEAVFADNARAGARLIFECAAPGLYGAQETRDWRAGYAWWRGECQKRLAPYANDHQVYIAVATQAGRTRDEDFPGGGYLFGPD